MEKDELTWRSFADQGAIVGKWKPPGTPTYYLIDHNGVIRSKWTGRTDEKIIDAALEELIKEVERDNKVPK